MRARHQLILAVTVASSGRLLICRTLIGDLDHRTATTAELDIRFTMIVTTYANLMCLLIQGIELSSE